MRTPSAYHVIISHGPQTIPNLEVGFTLRCFQSLSVPYIATLRCPWQEQQIDQRYVQLGPLVLKSNLLKILRLQ